MLNHLRCMSDISYCDVIYYVIYVICSHYVSKAISPLFAWPSSCMNLNKSSVISKVYKTINQQKRLKGVKRTTFLREVFNIDPGRGVTAKVTAKKNKKPQTKTSKRANLNRDFY